MTADRIVFCPRCAAPFTSERATWHRLCPACRPASKPAKTVCAPESKRCPICGAIFGKRANEAPSEFARRAFCSRSCGSRSRGARYAHLERPEPRSAPKPIATPPKPRMATQKLCGPKPEPTGLTTIKKKPMDYPAVDPALCVFPARTPIWASDGAAIVADLHAHRPICASLVRGWASTTAEGTDGWRTPWFETAAGAALWDAICEHRLGRREGRAA